VVVSGNLSAVKADGRRGTEAAAILERIFGLQICADLLIG
jgi:hypothetical protein